MPLLTERPTKSDESILKEVAKQLSPKVKQWLGSEDDCSLEELEKDLFNAMGWGECDGYKIAKRLDDIGWFEVDSELVDILDQASSFRYEICKKAEEAWVKENNLQPIPVNTKVKIIESNRFSSVPKNVIGIITSNYADGKSTVFYESLGHVRSGVGSHGFIIEWEKLEIVP